jgi:hypothetical protein
MYVIKHKVNGMRLDIRGDFSYYDVPRLFTQSWQAAEEIESLAKPQDFEVKPAYIQHEVLFVSTNSEFAEKLQTRLAEVAQSDFFKITLECTEQGYELIATYNAANSKHAEILKALGILITTGACTRGFYDSK